MLMVARLRSNAHAFLPVSTSLFMADQPVLRVAGLTKTYRSGDRALTVLKDVGFEVYPGETCAIVGPSGSGKTTLLGLAAGLDRPSSGTVEIAGISLGPMSEDERAAVRNQHVGFVFQSFQLIPTLTAQENVMVPAELRGDRSAGPRAIELLTQVGLGDRTDHYPTQLSGGEQQRVALARAFINAPRILFADEPTGNLDADTSAAVEKLIFDLNQTAGTTLVVVTHDLDLAHKTDRIIRLRGGEIVSDTRTVEAVVS
ncbi:MAG: ABC transporter ATP-binding protein [Rhodothermales bacterium]